MNNNTPMNRILDTLLEGVTRGVELAKSLSEYPIKLAYLDHKGIVMEGDIWEFNGVPCTILNVDKDAVEIYETQKGNNLKTDTYTILLANLIYRKGSTDDKLDTQSYDEEDEDEDEDENEDDFDGIPVNMLTIKLDGSPESMQEAKEAILKHIQEAVEMIETMQDSEEKDEDGNPATKH